MEKTLFIAALLAVFASAGRAQPTSADFPVSRQSFRIPQSPVVDSTADAVVLSDVGSIAITGRRNENWFVSVYRRKRRILLLHKAAFSMASAQVYLNQDDQLDSLEVTTYNLDNGRVVATRLDPKDIFDDKMSGEITRKRFTHVNLQEGSIVEISVKLTMDRVDYLPDWHFQYQDYPCLYSSFTFVTPEVLRYAVLRKGIDSIAVAEPKSKWQVVQMATLSVSDDIYTYHWEGKDIPPLREKDFIHAKTDYLDKLELYLTKFASAGGNYNHKNWKDINDLGGWPALTTRLLNSPYFGVPTRADHNENLTDFCNKLTAAAANPLESAQMIYRYVRDNFTAEEAPSLMIYKSLYDINKAKKGDPTEINMLLLGLLRVKGLRADPVALSTRSFGYHNVQYPLEEKLNYVIVRLQVFGETWYLDATDPDQAFGKIPLDCYNGHARVISDRDTGDVFFHADSIHEMNNTTVFIENDDKGFTGYYESTPGYYQSLLIKDSVRNIGFANFFHDYHGGSVLDMQFSNESIDSLHFAGAPVKLHFDFSLRGMGDEDLFYFTPVMTTAYRKNPFSAVGRRYPVEMDMPIDEMYVLNMELPKGYKIEELPKPAKVSFGNSGSFNYSIQADAERIQLRSRIQLNRTFFDPDEYNDLRAFFASIIKKQSEQIVFKKIKT
jgi:transglutaminase-like putative cysteine protease